MGERVVVAGASGFVGTHLVRRLTADGHDVVGGSRDPRRAAEARPDVSWTRFDVDDVDGMPAALEGASVLVYLVHRMREAHGAALGDSETAAAARVAQAAARAGVRRIVYLGGPLPEGTGSEHLKARAATGEALRSGPVGAVELRAAMIVGHGSESWLIVRDLALRLPVMVLPSWLATRSQPIAIDDVVAALSHAVTDAATGVYDLPGPQTLSAEEVLVRVAAQVGTRPVLLRVPVLTPGLSSHWIRLVTRADFGIARQLVDGLTHDIVCDGPGWFARMPQHARVPFDEAVRKALADEGPLSGPGGSWERAVRRLSRRA